MKCGLFSNAVIQLVLHTKVRLEKRFHVDFELGVNLNEFLYLCQINVLNDAATT